MRTNLFNNKDKHSANTDIIELEKYRKLSEFEEDNRFIIRKEDLLFINNKNEINDEYDRHYLYHMAWAMRVINQIKPEKHIDISSFLYFPVMLSALLPVEYYEYRPANLYLDNLQSKQADLTNLPFEDNSIKSLSCMHTVEHVGLGRYGDDLDPKGDIKAMEQLCRVLEFDGDLLFVVPVGIPRIQFNAHRIYSYEMIIDQFADLELVQFGLISMNDLKSGINYQATAEDVMHEKMGCGCFWFRKAKNK